MRLRYFLPAYLLVYVVIAFVWRSYRVWKRTGSNPVTFKGSDSAHDLIGSFFKVVFVLLAVDVLVYSFVPKLYKYCSPFDWLMNSRVNLVGIALMVLSLIWTVIAQAQMGESWRIGIDSEHQTSLVQTGIFSLSRNPIFVGMIITLLGLFLVIPDALTLLALIMGGTLIAIQVRLEEEFLRKTHGDEYARYSQRVRRWL